MKGFVSCVKHSSGGNTCYITSVEGESIITREYKSGVVLKIGEVVQFMEEGGMIGNAAILSEEGYGKSIFKNVDLAVERICSRKEYRTGIGEIDSVTAKMWSRLGSAARLLFRKIALGAPIVIRYHNDVDGATGAYALYNALVDTVGRNPGLYYKQNILWMMQRGVIYSMIDASSDIFIANNYSSVSKPLLILMDFGTSLDSNRGIEIAKERFDVIWLDHHPLIDGFVGKEMEHYINPWAFGGDSNYTAGFLACVFSKTFSSSDNSTMEGASFIGDYSKYAKPDEKSREAAMLLDLITSDVHVAISSMSDNLSPQDIAKIMNDREKSRELVAYANTKLGEVMDSALQSVKIHSTKSANIYVLDFEKVRNTDSRYPLPGRFASSMLGKIEELNKKDCVLVVHFGSYISMRVSKPLQERANALGIIEEIKQRFEGDVEAGGGHQVAASIKLANDDKKGEILKAVVESFKKELDK